MKIGNVTINGNMTLAPLAGYTDIAFRRLCIEYGASLATTEMISVAGLNYRNGKTVKMAEIADNEDPSCLQLFGREPEQFVRALTHPSLEQFDIIDINMGCPMRKIISNGEGSALMDDRAVAENIVKSLKSATSKPITVKMRLGVRDKLGAVDFAKAMEQAGADMITVHGRTAKQLYSGEADWEAIREVAKNVSVPVFGNGDVLDLSDSKLHGVSGYAIGRGAVYNPQIFSEKKHTIYEVIKKHIEYIMLYFDERYLVSSMRKFFAYYLKGIKGGKPIRIKLILAPTYNEVMQILEDNKALLNVL